MRFKFGKNWQKFSTHIDKKRVALAEKSLTSMLTRRRLNGLSFLDVGSGSGLFSLAARNLGASVKSFDYDNQCVICTKNLKNQFYKTDNRWSVEQGSILDDDYLKGIGQYDIVYSWGVLHHTGNLIKACNNVTRLVKPHGLLYVAIYNNQKFISKYWLGVKKMYNFNRFLRPLLIAIHIPYPFLASLILNTIRNRNIPRGMTIWYDLIDWLGGYPFEVASPDQVFEIFKENNFELVRMVTVGGKMGCNEFVFKKK